MRILKIMGGGAVLWGATLIWPEFNHWLTEVSIIKGLLGLSLVALLDLIIQYFDGYHHHHNGKLRQILQPIHVTWR